MLLLGTCNPSGERAQYNGLYYTADELAALVHSNALRGVPVKTDHTGNEIGRVVSGFLDASGALQCVMEVDESTLEGAIAGGFVRDGVAADLSLGYSVDVQHTDDRLKAGAKKMLEISIVRRGARRGGGKEQVYFYKLIKSPSFRCHFFKYFFHYFLRPPRSSN